MIPPTKHLHLLYTCVNPYLDINMFNVPIYTCIMFWSLCFYIYMYRHLHVYSGTHLFMFTYTYIYLHYMYIYLHLSTSTYIYIYTFYYIPVFIFFYFCTHIDMYTNMLIFYIHTNIHSYITSLHCICKL